MRAGGDPQAYNHLGKVEDWKRLTMLSGKLNSAQMENVKVYPFIILEKPYPEDLDIKIDYDLKVDYKAEEGRRNPGYVRYDIQTDEGVSYDESMLGMVRDSLRTLFWNDLKVLFAYNGEQFWSTDDA